MSSRSIWKLMATVTILLCAAGVKAQQMPNPYGASDLARKREKSGCCRNRGSAKE